MKKVYEHLNTEHIPILIFAFCRPRTLAAQLERIEKLSQRHIWISVDGHADQDFPLKKEHAQVIAISRDFSLNSKHTVNVIVREANLGLLLHFKEALSEFFSVNDVGIVLEDDIDFDFKFVSLVENLWKQGQLEKYWSVCGHNPDPSSGAMEATSSIDLFETFIHTIWGWASTAQNVNFFLDYLSEPNLEIVSLRTIDSVSKRLTFNPLLRWLFRKIWIFKLNRALTCQKPNWDNFWEIAGWNSNKSSLMPYESLSVESNSFCEAQTHEGSRSAPRLRLRDDSNSKIATIDSRSRRRDTKLLSVWGISHTRFLKLLLAKLSRPAASSRDRLKGG